jgi:DNA-binding transcriptional LysR family regulator
MEANYLAAAALKSENPSISGIVRIGTPDGFGTFFLAPRLRKLAAQHPNLEIELLATARLFSLSKREADIVISLTSPEHARVVSRRLTDYELLVYAAPAYLAAHPPILSPADFSRHEFVGYIEDMLFTPELNYLSLIGANLSPRIRSTNLITQMQAALAGAGLCVLPVFIARDYPGLVPVLPEAAALTRAFFMPSSPPKSRGMPRSSGGRNLIPVQKSPQSPGRRRCTWSPARSARRCGAVHKSP